MIQLSPSPVVQLAPHTGDLAHARSFYSRVCGRRLEQIGIGNRSHEAFDSGGGLEGGVVECGASRAVWIPDLDISRIDETTARARRFVASVVLEPREGAAGRRSIPVPEGGEIAFRQSKTRTDGR